MENKPRLISIVIPVHNESDNVTPLVDELQKIGRERLPKYSFEIIFVDDSTDDTWNKIQALSSMGVKGLRFTRRFGHQAAIEAGLSRARGEAVITMDGDFQHPPELIVELISRWEDGFEVVTTKRSYSNKIPLLKRVLSNLFYKIFNAFSDVPMEPGSVDFRLLSRHALTLLQQFPEKQKFYRGLIPLLGLSTTQIRFVVPPRRFGKTSYTMRRMVSLAILGMTSLTSFPMKGIFYSGCILALLGSIGSIATLLLKITLIPSMSVFIPFTLLIICNTGIVLTGLGIHAIYTSALYHEVLRRPNYIISEESNFDE